jgi:ABC-type lipoprotein export system ATPase subunit
MSTPDTQDCGRIGRSIELGVIREPAWVPMSPRKRQICWDFGVPAQEEPVVVVQNLTMRLGRGTISLLSGPSGSGKSSILHAVAERIGRVAWVGCGGIPNERAIVDAIAPSAPLGMALEILTACGLGEPRLWIRRFEDLSEGERFRVCLAAAIGSSLGEGEGEGRPILSDEFTAGLHRRMAKAIAYNLRKLVSRYGLTLIVATAHEDVREDLQPDEMVKLGSAKVGVVYHAPRDQPISLRRHVTIEQGSVRDYHSFGAMHYRDRDGLGFVDKVFLLRESAGGEPLGVLVFAHAPMELALRNHSTEGRFRGNVRRLNREVRILRRLVMHPDVRGCGLGHWFVAHALPLAGVRFIESLASMGAVNPVFERAGMRRVGRCPMPRGRLDLLQRMRRRAVDPFAPGFVRQIAGCPLVRGMVERTIADWTRRTQSTSPYRVEGRLPSELAHVFRQIISEPPVYYLWDREGVYPRGEESAEAADRSHPLISARREGDRPGGRERGSRGEDRHRPEAKAGSRRRVRDRGAEERRRPR